MKTYKNLYPQITSLENLYTAFRKAARGKRKKADVAAFEFHLEESLIDLQDDLVAQTYRPGPYRSFEIQDPKPRRISAAPFRDRVVHHALCQIIEPIFERRFIYDSYACRIGKGTHAALDRAQRFARQYPYVLQCDLEHFFPSIDHSILDGQFVHVIGDAPTLWLCRQILDSGAGVHPPNLDYFPGDDLWAPLRPHGLPIGNLTSQFWANVYLNPLDQFIKRELKCPAYVRYVDDFLLFAPDKPSLHGWRQAVIEFSAGLRLRLHERRAAVFPVNTGIPFLGWRIYPDRRRLKRRNGVAFQRRLKALCHDLAAARIDRERFQTSVRSWIAHAEHGNTWNLRRAILSSVVLPGGV